MFNISNLNTHAVERSKPGQEQTLKSAEKWEYGTPAPLPFAIIVGIAIATGWINPALLLFVVLYSHFRTMGMPARMRVFHSTCC